MKKILMSLAAVAAITFASCGGGAKPEQPATPEQATPEQVAPEQAAPAEGNVLAQCEEFLNKALPLTEKMQAGDATAVQEYTKLKEEFTKFTQDNATAFSSLSEADLPKYKELSEKLAAAFSK